MSEYAVNKQTGEVLKRDEGGQWTKVQSARNPTSGEILINEGSGWGAVPKSAPAPSMAAEKPDFNAPMSLVSEGGPQSLGQMKIPGLQEYIVSKVNEEKGAKENRAQLRADATEAGRQAMAEAAKRMGVNSPFEMAMAGPALQISMLEGGRQVYDQAGVMMPDEAMGLNILNAQSLGIPAFASKQFREDLRQAHEDQPGSALAGEVVGSFVPGESIFQIGKMGYNRALKPVVSKLLPKGGSAAAKATRFGAHGAEQAGAWAGQNAAYQATTGASRRAAEEGRDPTFGDVVEGAVSGATDPINLVGPAAGMALNRIFTAVRSGGRTWTPKDRADYVSDLGGKSPGSGSILDAGMVGSDVDQRAERILINMLRDAGYTRDDISRSLSAFDQAAQGNLDLPVLTSRLKDVFIEQLGPEAEQVVQKFLQGGGVSAGQAGRMVQDASTQDYGRIGQFLEDSGNARLGSGSRWDTVQGAQEEMQRIGREGYQQIFAAPPQNPQAMEQMAADLNFFANSELSRPLKQVAAGKGMTVDQMIQQDPRQAAHWMQHTAGGLAQEAADNGNATLARAYGEMRSRLLNSLEAEGVAPGYRDARLKYGDEYGIVSAQNFGSRFFTKVQDTIGVKQLAEDYQALTPDQQAMARMSIRDEYNRLIGRHRTGAAPRMTQVDTESALAGLEEVLGPEGSALANDIRYGSDRLRRTQAVDQRQNSRTASNQEAKDFANNTVANPIMRKLGNALQTIGGDAALTSATGGHFAPILSMRAIARGMGENLARGRQGKIDDVTSLLLRDVGANPRPSMPGDIPPSTSPASAPQGIARSAPQQTTQGINALARNESGFVRPDAASAMMTAGGAGAGALNPIDFDGDGKKSAKERAMTAALYGGGAYAINRGVHGLDRLGRAPQGAATEFRVRPGESGSSRIQFRAGGERWDTLPTGFGSESEAMAQVQRLRAGKPLQADAIYGPPKDEFEAMFRNWWEQTQGSTAPRFAEAMKNNDGLVQKAILEMDPSGQAFAGFLKKYMPDEWAQYMEAGGGADGKSFAEAVAKSLGNLNRELDSMTRPSGANASRDFNLEAWNPNKPKTSGIASNLSGPTGGAIAGGLAPLPDQGSTEDNLKARGLAIAGGALAGSRFGRNALRDVATAGPSGKLPKLMKDVPKGTRKPGQRPDISGTIARGHEQASGVPIAKAIGGENMAYQTAKREAEDMASRNVGLEEIQRRTGLVPISYRGQTVWRGMGDDITPYEANQLFYEALKLPPGERAEWVQDILNEVGPKLDTLELGGKKAPLQLGGQRTPMVKPGKNALSGQ